MAGVGGAGVGGREGAEVAVITAESGKGLAVRVKTKEVEKWQGSGGCR